MPKYVNPADDNFIKLSSINFINNEELKVDRVINAIINPLGNNNNCGVYDENYNISLMSLERNNFQYNKKYINNSEVKLINETVIYLGAFNTTHWGNLLIDFISRIWYLLENIDARKLRIVYCGSLNSNSLSFNNSTVNFIQLLKLLDIELSNMIDIRIPTRFKRVIVPEKSFIPFISVSPFYLTIYDYICLRVTSEYYYDKIYFTRTKLTNKKEIGEEIFESFFRSNGFKIISPELLTLNEQIYACMNCKIFASFEGTLAHNIVWAKKCNKQIILRKQSEVISRQLQLNQIKNIPVEYIDAYLEPFRAFPINHDRGPFLLFFSKYMLNYAKDNNYVLPKSTLFYNINNFIKYSIKCIIFYIKHNLKFIKKYI